jgi:Flp pilus assembly protein TadB
MITNFLMAFIAAVGIFFIVISLRWRRSKANLKRIDALRRMEPSEEDIVVTGEETEFFKTLRSCGLERAVAQADLPVTAAGFIRFGIILALIAFAITYVLTAGPLVSAFVAFASIVLYIYWLHWRRDEKRLEYEESLADMCDRISAGAMLTSTLQGAMTHAADVAPDIVRDDFNYIAGQLTQTASINQAFGPIIRRRRSYSLELIAETLEVWTMRGATIPLQEVLNPLSTTIRELSAERRRMLSELSGVRRQMMLVAIAPVFFVALLRLSSPALGRIYTTPTGELIQIIAYTISAVGFLVGQRFMNSVQQFLEVEEG